jgi:hypothetical protein
VYLCKTPQVFAPASEPHLLLLSDSAVRAAEAAAAGRPEPAPEDSQELRVAQLVRVSHLMQVQRCMSQQANRFKTYIDTAGAVYPFASGHLVVAHICLCTALGLSSAATQYPVEQNAGPCSQLCCCMSCSALTSHSCDAASNESLLLHSGPFAAQLASLTTLRNTAFCLNLLVLLLLLLLLLVSHAAL